MCPMAHIGLELSYDGFISNTKGINFSILEGYNRTVDESFSRGIFNVVLPLTNYYLLHQYNAVYIWRDHPLAKNRATT